MKIKTFTPSNLFNRYRGVKISLDIFTRSSPTHAIFLLVFDKLDNNIRYLFAKVGLQVDMTICLEGRNNKSFFYF